MTAPEQKKHSVRYNSTVNDAVIRSVYIMKTAFPKGVYPEQVTLKLEVPD
jgi:hypothetical protein